jgi:prepilin-type N-terminal cleavage/methylation domain-containing protein
MNAKYRQSGLTLIEITVVIAVMALLIGLGLPAVHAFLNSFQSEGSTMSMISSALASAQAIATKNQKYAGIRFQKAYRPDGPLKAPQYMIFIVQDPDIMAYGFRAVPGLKPIRLPETIGVMDLRLRTNPDPIYSGDEPIDNDAKIDQPAELQDTTSFSVMFSPSGKLVIHDVRVRNRHGVYRPANPSQSTDDIFNSQENIVNYNTGMFIQDDYANLGLGKEASRNTFIIYEEQKFRRAYTRGRAWSEYLVTLAPQALYINPYTGTIISPSQ